MKGELHSISPYSQFHWYQIRHDIMEAIRLSYCPTFNTLRPRQNGRHFPVNFLEWKCMNFNYISLKFVPRGPINNIPTLVQVMAWRRPGDKPLPESMMVRLPTHICVTRPQWIKWSRGNSFENLATPDFKQMTIWLKYKYSVKLLLYYHGYIHKKK